MAKNGLIQRIRTGGTPAAASTTPEPHYTPTSLLAVYNNTITVSVELEQVTVRGVFRRGNDKVYAGYCYDKLQEVAGECVLPLKVRAALRAGLSDGAACRVSGVMTRQVQNSGNISVNLLVSEVLDGRTDDGKLADELEAKRQILLRRAERPRFNAEQVLHDAMSQGRRPRIVAIYGSSAKTDADVRTALGPASASYEMLERKCAMTDPRAVFDAVAAAERDDKPDLVAIVRGGGAGLETFDSLELADSLLQFDRFPIVCAIGHELDHPFVEQVVDKVFSTPTAFGNWLKWVADNTAESVAKSKAAIVRAVEEQFKGQTEQYKAQIVALTCQIGQLIAQANTAAAETQRQAGALVRKSAMYAYLAAVAALSAAAGAAASYLALR